jgi:hypothetical protein
VRRADNLTTLMCRLSRNPGVLTSRTPQGHVGLFRGYFTFYIYNINVISAWKTYHIRQHVQYSPDDERNMFETCQRQQLK